MLTSKIFTLYFEIDWDITFMDAMVLILGVLVKIMIEERDRDLFRIIGENLGEGRDMLKNIR